MGKMIRKDNMANDNPNKVKGLSGMDSEQRAYLITLAVLGIISLVALIFDAQLFGADSPFRNNLGDNSVINFIYHSIPAVFRTCQILFVALLLFFVLREIQKGIKADTNFQTSLRLIISFTRYAIFIIAIIAVLASWGVDTQTLLVSAGILGLIIGLGAQSLIADIIAGLFIVFDGIYKVGDIIVVEGWRGTVMEIGIRTTKIIDAGGNIKYINNSTIRAVVNQSQELSVIKTELSIFYDEDLEKVELLIKDYLPKITGRIPYIVNGPYYKGVNGMSNSSVELLFLAECDEHNFYLAKRALNREIYRMANELDIKIPYDQIVVNQPLPEGTFGKDTVTPEKKREATAFAYNQAEIAKDMERENEN